MREKITIKSKKLLALLLAFAVILCSLTTGLAAFAEESETVSFILDATTNGGSLDGEPTMRVEAAKGATYTTNVTVMAPTGQQFVGWSTKADDYVGELNFVPEDSTTYYAIFAEVLYFDGTTGATPSGGGKGTKENPYLDFSAEKLGNTSPFKTNAKNCIAVLSGAVNIKSISAWARTDKFLYITGVDPTTGVQNTTSITLASFALGQSGVAPVFGAGVCMDYITITTITNPAFYLRGGAKNFRIGTHVINDATGPFILSNIDSNIDSVYIESGVDKVGTGNNYIQTATSASIQIANDATVVINKGFYNFWSGGIQLAGKIGGNANVVINDYTPGKALHIRSTALTSVGSINYIFNNNTRATIAAASLRFHVDANGNETITSVPAQNGIYYIDSAIGGKILPTDTAGKFKVEFDEGYNYIMVNGNRIELDSDNCFTIAESSNVVNPTVNDFTKITYGYETPVVPDEPGTGGDENKVSFTLDAATNGGTVNGSANIVAQATADVVYTSNATVTAPQGQQFIGWSKNKDAYVGELTFTPQNGTTYYAIFGEVLYFDGTTGATPANGGKGTKDKPYLDLSAEKIGNTIPYTSSAKNCIAVVSGAINIKSISAWARQANKRLYITGIDPTTGVKNDTSITVATFALGQSNVEPVFGLGVYMDHITISAVSGNPVFYLRGGAKNFVLGNNVINNATGAFIVGGVDCNVDSVYIESGVDKVGTNNNFIQTAYNSSISIAGDATVVINKGYYNFWNGGVYLAGNIGGIASVVVNGYTAGQRLHVRTSTLSNAAAINYIFNNNIRATIAATNLRVNVDENGNETGNAVPTQGGFFYIDSAKGGKIMPTDTVGKFKVEFNQGFNYIKVNGERVEIDSNNCFTLTASTAVIPTTSDWYNITYHYEAAASPDNIIEVPVNHIINLSKIGIAFEGETNPISGTDVTWATCKQANAELTNGRFLAFGEGEVLVTATYAGKSTGVTFKITADAAAQEGMSRFAPQELTVTRVGDNTYTVTVTETEEKVLKYGTLKNGSTIISEVVGTTGTTFKFTTDAPQNMSLSAQFITAAERANSMFPLGAGIRPETDEYSKAIRFITRFTAIQKNSSDIALNEEFTQVGVLMLPEILWDGTYPEASALVVADSDEDGVTEVVIGSYTAQNLKISKLRTATEKFSDAAAAIYDIPEDMNNVKMVAIPYMLGADGTVTYMDEADINPTSFGEIFAKEFPLNSGKDYSSTLVKEVFALIGTNHELDEDPNSNAITYEVGEEIIFTVVTAGNYGFEYELYKDNNGPIAEYGEASVAGVETCVKKGTYDPVTDGPIFTLTTRLDNPGTVRLAIKVKDAGGTYLTFKGDKNLSVTAAAGADQIALPSYMVETEENMDAFYSTISTNYADQVERIKDALQSTEMVNWFMGSKTKGEIKKYADAKSDLFEITYVGPSSSGIYDQYTVVLATVESIPGVSSPLTSADLNTGKFPYNDYLKRPSTFMLTVPAAAGEDSCPIISGYYGYGTNAGQFEWNAGTISVSTTAHGLINLQAQSYYDKAVNILYNEGGTKGGIMYDYENQTDPTKLYAYGMLVRDYLSLQFAKFMPQFDENSTITTKGGSQGGFQAVGVAAADEDVDICNSHITWLTIATVAGDQFYDGWTPAYTDAFKYIMSQNAVVSIGNRPGFVLNIEAALSDQTCPLYGLLAMYNTSKTKTNFVGYQFSSHNYTMLFAQAYGDAFTVRMNKN